MLSVSLYIASAAVFAAIALNIWRLVVGPNTEDRILALDTLYINTIAVVVLVSITLDTRTYFEAALLIATMGFIGTIALAKYLLRGNLFD